MSPALLSALEVASVAALVVAVFRLSRQSRLIAHIRFALAGLGLLGALLLVESQLSHPGKEAFTKATLAVIVVLGAYVLLQIADHVVWEKLLKPRHISAPRLLFDVVNALVLAGVALTLLKVLYSFNLTGLLVTSTVLSPSSAFPCRTSSRASWRASRSRWRARSRPGTGSAWETRRARSSR